MLDESMRDEGGYDVVLKVCEAIGQVAAEHDAEHYEGHREAQDDKTLALNAFKDPCPSLTKSRLCSARDSIRGT